MWGDAVDLAVACYEASRHFPRAEKFGLTSQIQRAAASIAANLAEGAGRKTDPEFARFVRIAAGSANEAETYLVLAQRLGYLDASTSTALARDIEAVKRQLAGLERSLRSGS